MILLIDNYDSFTYNLVHFLGDLGAQTVVRRNDHISVAEVIDLEPRAIVISPGPCDPERAGICLDLVRETAKQYPIFGVCLGAQTIGQAFGGHVVRADTQMHGKLSRILHNGKSVFTGLDDGFEATRYHSLIIERKTLPDCLEITAETEDGIIMGIAHRELPIHGVQFHPESIASEHGHALLRNFLDIAQAA